MALLESVGQEGSICTYTGYERSVLTGLADALPHLRPDLDRVCDRLWDLHPIIKAHYYHPAFDGSYSIKAVLPAVAPHLAYDDLAIQEGMMASLQFHRMVFGDGDSTEKATPPHRPPQVLRARHPGDGGVAAGAPGQGAQLERGWAR